MRKKFTLLLLLLLVASLTLSGCSLVVKDKVKDAAQIVLRVNDDTVNKEEFLRRLGEEENYLINNYAYTYQMYQYYGIGGFSMPSSEQIHAEAVKNVYDAEVKEFILKQKGAELGQDTLTDEETAAAKADAEANFNEMLQQVIDGGYLGETASEGDGGRVLECARWTFDAPVDTQDRCKGRCGDRRRRSPSSHAAALICDSYAGWWGRFACYPGNPWAFGHLDNADLHACRSYAHPGGVLERPSARLTRCAMRGGPSAQPRHIFPTPAQSRVVYPTLPPSTSCICESCNSLDEPHYVGNAP